MPLARHPCLGAALQQGWWGGACGLAVGGCLWKPTCTISFQRGAENQGWACGPTQTLWQRAGRHVCMDRLPQRTNTHTLGDASTVFAQFSKIQPVTDYLLLRQHRTVRLDLGPARATGIQSAKLSSLLSACPCKAAATPTTHDTSKGPARGSAVELLPEVGQFWSQSAGAAAL